MRQLIAVMKEVGVTNPDIHYHLYSGNDEDVSERLDKGLVDFGLFVGHTSLEKYDYLKLQLYDTWGLLMRSDFPLAEKEKIYPKDMKNLPILCSRQALTNNELSGWLGQDFAKLNIVSTHNLIYNAKLMVEEGLGCALTIEGLVNTTKTDLVFRPLEPTVKAELIIAWKKYQVFSKAAQVFLECLQNKLAYKS